MSRNYHKSVYREICLNQLKVFCVYPREVEGLGVQGGITAGDMGRMFNRCMDTQAVFTMCPTYDEVVSDIEAITRAVHRAGLPLIAGEAHGVYFHYGAMFPTSTLDPGTDVVIQGIHKTFLSLIQTALLYIKCNRPDGGCYADREWIDRYIYMMQSNSPSYVLMVNIENNICQMGRTGMAPYGKRPHKLRQELGQTRHLRLAGTGLMGRIRIGDLDISKIVVSTRRTHLHPTEDGLTGFIGAQLDNTLRREYYLGVETCGTDYMTTITTVMDNGEGPERLRGALTRIGSQLTDVGHKPNGRNENQKNVHNMQCGTAMPMGEAIGGSVASVDLENNAGRISEELVYIYPSDIPVVAPGRRISGPILEVILEYRDKGFPVQGPADQPLRTTRVVQKD